MDDFGLLVAQYNTTLPTLTDGQYSELELDVSGRLIISGRYFEDSAHVSGDAGLFMMGVRNDAGTSLVDADGDYMPFSFDADGKLWVNATVSIDMGAEKLEDDAHVSGDQGNYVLAVRADARPTDSNTSADGDYSSFFVNDSGELYVKDTDVLAQLVTIDGVLDSIKVDTAAMVVDLAAIEVELLDQGTTLDSILADTASIDTEIQALSHAEDSAHVSGDNGIMGLAVRNDADTSLVDADGDYSPLQVNSTGRLKVATTIDAVGSEEYTVTDALAAAGDGLETITAAATPWITVASFAHTSGVAYVYGYQWACDQNAQVRLVTDDTTDTVIYKTDINSSAQPGKSEHWSNEGRIEIAGTVGLEIRLQIKKRSTPGGNANGTGSIHIRK